MKEYPIPFNTQMVKAILNGRKTQTRRVIQPQPLGYPKYRIGLNRIDGRTNVLWDDGIRMFGCHYGQPGDRLWVRETWAEMCKYDPLCNCETDEEIKQNHYFEYRADTGDPYPGSWPVEEAKGNPEAPKWKSSRFMPRIASRIMLEIVNVRVKRLQEICVRDCCIETGAPVEWPGPGPEPYKRDMRKVFSILWDSLNAKRGYGWDLNPWVWVIEFKKISPS